MGRWVWKICIACLTVVYKPSPGSYLWVSSSVWCVSRSQRPKQDPNVTCAQNQPRVIVWYGGLMVSQSSVWVERLCRYTGDGGAVAECQNNDLVITSVTSTQDYSAPCTMKEHRIASAAALLTATIFVPTSHPSKGNALSCCPWLPPSVMLLTELLKQKKVWFPVPITTVTWVGIGKKC